MPAISLPFSTTISYTEFGRPWSIAASIPCRASGSRFSSFFNFTVSAIPAKLEGKIGPSDETCTFAARQSSPLHRTRRRLPDDDIHQAAPRLPCLQTLQRRCGARSHQDLRLTNQRRFESFGNAIANRSRTRSMGHDLEATKGLVVKYAANFGRS